MKYIVEYKWRLLTFSILSAALMTGSFVFSSVLAGPRRSSPAQNQPAMRTAVTTPATSFTFSSPQVLVRPPIIPIPGGIVSLKDQDVEPEIKVDLFGNIYITAIHGVPGGVDLWKSTDNGATFVYLGEPDGAQDRCDVNGTSACTAGAGGGDDALDISSGGYVYLASLYLGGLTVSVSKDGGTGGSANTDQAWTVNPASSGIPVNDRQWIAAYGPQTLYMTFDQAPANTGIWFTKSTDAGKTFSPPVMLTAVGGLSRENNLVVDRYNGNLYTTYTPVSAPNQLKLLKSTDGGATWTTSTVVTWPAGTSVENSFPILAVDRGGNLHLAYAKSTNPGPVPARTNCHVYLMSSSDQGTSWLPPVQVDSGPGSNSAVMPWIVAGSPGVVDVTWYGSTMSSPDSVPDSDVSHGQWWNVFFAQTTNALDTTPTFSQTQVASNVHNDAICSRGGNCSGSTRDLAEYYTMTIDNDGNAHIAFVDGINGCPGPKDNPPSNCYARTWYTKQTAGPSALIPPTGPAPATFSPNISLGSPGGEPGLKVDSHNCIFATAPGEPWLRKSVNNGASFLPKVDPVADRRLRGGDEEVLSVPQADGARPDLLYFADLASLTSINIAKSSDGGTAWAAPGAAGAAGQVDASSDRQWLAFDRNIPASGDLTVYEMDHEAASEAIRFNALTNDTAWSPAAAGMTDPELLLANSTFPNTNPGPVFTDPRSHLVYGVFNASTVNTNRDNPPFGKMPNVWEAVGAAPAAAGAPPGPFTDHPVFKGLFDSPSSPQPTPPPGTQTFGTTCSNDFPSAAIDNAGNIYVVWAMNNARTNEYMIWFASSHDHGNSFYGPFQVSKGPGAAVMPWIAAGDSGRVAVVYYATTQPGDPNFASPTNTHWNAMFAQSLNGDAREPVFTISQVSDHVMHNGGICNLGLLCQLTTGGDRSLADFFQVAIGPDGKANVVFADNGTGATHATFARQTSGPIALVNPTFPTCIAAPTITPVSAVSRKVHGSSTFDLPLALTGNPTIECRSGGANKNYQVLITFSAPVTSVSGAFVTYGAGTASVNNVNGSTVTVDLTGVNTGQYITITLTDVQTGPASGNAAVSMGVLVGDVNQSGLVDVNDVSAVQSRTRQRANTGNFLFDVNPTGLIDTNDVSLTQSQTRTVLQGPPP